VADIRPAREHYASRMRHLTRQFAIGALRRGGAIAQFLGGAEVDGEPAIRWVAISPEGGRYRISLHTVQDPDDDRVGDLPNLISLDPVDEDHVGEDRELGLSEDEEDATALAEQLTDARPDRWVNHEVVDDEYVDHARSRQRPARTASPIESRSTANPSPTTRSGSH
jgi:hypothetical protein